MPPALQFLVLTFAGWVNRHQDDLIAYLREENRVLREHLGPRPLRLTDAYSVPSPTDAVRHWPAKPSHLIQDVAREVDLSPPPCGTARSKAVSDDRLVSEERVLHAGLPMIARHLLPASPSSLLDRQDRAITSARPRAASRHVGRTRRRNHDGRATRTGGLVKADRIVGGIRRHPSEGAVDRLDQRDPSRRVVDARLRQGPGDDHT